MGALHGGPSPDLRFGFGQILKNLAKRRGLAFYTNRTIFTEIGTLAMFSFDPEPLTIELFILPGCNLIQIASVIEPLRVANRVIGRDIYRWRFVSDDGADVITTSGMPAPVDGAFDPASSAYPLFVIASYQPQRLAAPELIRKLSLARRHRPVIGGIESGSWLLAEAALLTDRQVAVHWEDADRFASIFADITITTQQYVIDDQRFTTAGSLPTLDMMLELIRLRQGFAVAMAVTRQFIYARSGERDANTEGAESAPLSELAITGDARLGHILTLMDGNLAAPLPITSLAAAVNLSPRQLHKLFCSRLGAAPKRYYLALRHNAARRALIETGQPVLEIAEQTGFASQAAFATSYRTAYGETPSDTRAIRNRQGRNLDR